MPREATEGASIPLAKGLHVELPADPADGFAAKELLETLKERGVRASASSGAVRVTLSRLGSPAAARVVAALGGLDAPGARDEGYLLWAEGQRVEIAAATSAGIFYGVQTLAQLIEGTGATARLQGARVRDWPALRYRGFHDDVSRGPVPTLDFQKRHIRAFAAYKLNVYSPYFEHTLAYDAHPLMAPPGGAMSHEDVRALVAYARRYHVEVIPEQEAFGHLHHLLKHESYSGLAETEHGHVLAPDAPGTLPLIQSWFTEIDALFPGPFVHLGADETFELGRGRSAERVGAEGLGPVYVDFLRRISGVLPKGKRYLFWGDVAMNSPELVRTLPQGMIAVGWDYWSRDGFERYLTPFRDAGMEAWVAPGVNNWNRVYPDNGVALANIQGFVRDGQRLGATGVLNTSWDDDGEGLFNQVWYGVLFGAAAGWQPGESDIPTFQRHYGRVFHGDSTGKVDEAQRKLIAASALLDGAGFYGAADSLFWVDPWTGEGRAMADRMRPVSRPLRLLAEQALTLLAEARRQPLREPDALDALELGARRMGFIGMKFQLADEVARMYARACGSYPSALAQAELLDITSMNGRLEDLRDGYSLLRGSLRGRLAQGEPAVFAAQRAGPVRSGHAALDQPRGPGGGRAARGPAHRHAGTAGVARDAQRADHPSGAPRGLGARRDGRVAAAARERSAWRGRGARAGRWLLRARRHVGRALQRLLGPGVLHHFAASPHPVQLHQPVEPLGRRAFRWRGRRGPRGVHPDPMEDDAPREHGCVSAAGEQRPAQLARHPHSQLRHGERSLLAEPGAHVPQLRLAGHAGAEQPRKPVRPAQLQPRQQLRPGPLHLQRSAGHARHREPRRPRRQTLSAHQGQYPLQLRRQRRDAWPRGEGGEQLVQGALEDRGPPLARRHQPQQRPPLGGDLQPRHRIRQQAGGQLQHQPVRRHGELEVRLRGLAQPFPFQADPPLRHQRNAFLPERPGARGQERLQRLALVRQRPSAAQRQREEHGQQAPPRARRGTRAHINLPPSSASTRPQRCATRASCVERTTAVPASALDSSSASSTAWTLGPSRAPVGSSASTNRGSFTSARATATRCASPTDRVSARRAPSSAMRIRSSSASARPSSSSRRCRV